MTTHQQDSSQPQQSHSSPQEVLMGLMIDVIEEVVLPGIVKMVVRRLGCQVIREVSPVLRGRLTKRLFDGRVSVGSGSYCCGSSMKCA
jgi:hypothetical protein